MDYTSFCSLQKNAVADGFEAAGTEYSDVSTEEYREYSFGSKGMVVITKPVALHIRKSGAHCVVDDEGVTHYIPVGWLALRWKNANALGFINF